MMMKKYFIACTADTGGQSMVYHIMQTNRNSACKKLLIELNEYIQYIKSNK